MNFKTVRWLSAAALAVAAVAPACAAKTAETAKSAESVEAAAQVGTRKITLAEVDAKAFAENVQAYQALYDARKRVLDQMISESLLDGEAKTRGITREALLQQEVAAKIKPPTAAEVDAFYEQNKGGMQGRTLEQMRSQIEAFLGNNGQQTAMNSLIGELRKKASVKILLDPPRVEMKIPASAASRGPAGAPVQLLEFSDFQCPYCSRVGPTLAKIHETYGDKVRVVFRHFPLPFHDKAQAAAEAAQCAHAQGKFWEYHDKLFGNQSALAADNLKQYAVDLGLDATKFNACLSGPQPKTDVNRDHEEGAAMGVQGTPAFFVNGRFLSGAQPFEAFAAVIDEELQMAADKR